MTATLVRDSLHRDLLRNCVGSRFSEPDALLWMVLLHTHEIRMKPGAATNSNGSPVTAFAAITQRHAAQVVAELWSERRPTDIERSSYAYWYHQYNSRTPYEVFSDTPESLVARLIELREVLASDPRVDAVVPED
jgi:hypothetical protein